MNPILVEVYRGNVLESFHRGVICVVDRDNNILYSQGDVQQVCYPRSALKFFQQLPLLESGAFEHFHFTPEELAVMCGSHNGEAAHVATVDAILNKIQLQRSDLKCGPQYPSDRSTTNGLIRKNEKPQAIHNNCSGKHAGFLAMSVFLQADPASYLDPAHPVQQKVREVTADFHEYPASKMVTALDGCSAPIFSIPVLHQAIAYKNLVDHSRWHAARADACKKVVEAVSSHPFMVAGTGRYCTDMMQICGKKIIGKTGAEGVFSLALTAEKIGCSIKIDDGKMLPQYHVAQAFIKKSGLFQQQETDSLEHYRQENIVNFNKFITGEIKAAGYLFDGLQLQ
jgi:L-asparaginase II